MLRLTASARTGAVGASLTLKRIGADPKRNGQARAPREVRRIERTLYTLGWLGLVTLPIGV
jgi:TnpA family transposase